MQAADTLGGVANDSAFELDIQGGGNGLGNLGGGTAGKYSGLAMRCLSRLKDVSNLTHIHSYTLLMLGLLTLHATATCTYEYHQRHELHASANTIEKHNIYNTFTSVLHFLIC